MKIQLSGKDFAKITVRDLVAGFHDDGENGIVGYSGKLNIRPAYQREFVYPVIKRDEVIQTVRKNYPLNVMYWAVADNGDYELMDGQQRTVSICQYVNGDYSVDWDNLPRGFANLTSTEKDAILNYELTIYVCEGTKEEKIAWFNIINIASVPLSKQEILNANYTGLWLTDAKRWFSKTGAPAAQIGEKLVSDDRIRQGILERALKWISHKYGSTIKQYMADHQNDPDASELWQYYQEVIDWVNRVFPNQGSGRVRLMKGLEWGYFYNEYKDIKLNAQDLEKRILELIDDDEVENKKGIYEYLLTGDERTLSLRTFDEKIKVKKYEEQSGICPKCCKHYDFGEMEADHILPWSKGGKTVYENCQMLCRLDNRTKSGK